MMIVQLSVGRCQSLRGDRFLQVHIKQLQSRMILIGEEYRTFSARSVQTKVYLAYELNPRMVCRRPGDKAGGAAAGSVLGRLNRHAYLEPEDLVATPEDAKRNNRARPSGQHGRAWRTPGSAHHWTRPVPS